MSLLFNTLSRFVTAFLPTSKCLLISWLHSPSAVILEPKKRKSVTVSIVSPSICHEVMGPDALILVFWMLSFKPTLSFSSFTFIKRLFSSSLLSTVSVVSSVFLKLIFLPAILFIVHRLAKELDVTWQPNNKIPLKRTRKIPFSKKKRVFRRNCSMRTSGNKDISLSSFD